MAHDEMLAELDRRRAAAAAMGGEKKMKARKERGDLNAQERLDLLIDEGTFIETGLLGASGMFKEDEAKTPRDGKIVGFAQIDGRDVGVVVNDFTVKGASTSATHTWVGSLSELGVAPLPEGDLPGTIVVGDVVSLARSQPQVAAPEIRVQAVR